MLTEISLLEEREAVLSHSNVDKRTTDINATF